MSSSSNSIVIWKNINNFDKYEISNTGIVRNKRTLHEKKPSYDGKYWRISLSSGERNDKNKFRKKNI